MTDQRPADIVLFSTADWASQYLTNKQHTASRLAARGHRVLYVETVGLRPPGINAMDLSRIWVRLKRGLAPISQVRDNLWVLSPLTIPMGHRHAAIGAFNTWQLAARINGWLKQQRSRRPLVWTYHPFMLGVAHALDPSAVVYHCVDDLGAIPGIDRETFDDAERQLLERATLTFATSHLLQQRCSAIAGDKVHYFGNVADIAHFATARNMVTIPPEMAAIPQPRIGYIGVLSDFKIDFALLETLVKTHPDWHFVFIGEEREGQTSDVIARLRQRPNAHFFGWRPYERLPDYLSGFDVGILPQLINDYTRAMFPMKFFEYLAAGVPVVATPLPALRDLGSLHAIADNADGFAKALEDILNGRGLAPLELGDPRLLSNSWDARLDHMMTIIARVSSGS